MNMVEVLTIIYSIIPFIIGLITLALIPTKEKIINKEITSFKPEVHILIYILAFIPLVMGFYYSMSFFGDGIANREFTIINAIFLEVIALGIMGLNYRNFSIYSESSPAYLGRVESSEVEVVEPVSTTYEVSRTPSKTISTPQQTLNRTPYKTALDKDHQLVGCPSCGSAIKVNMSIRPVKISCPNCGIEGMVQ
jgi:hypothetical protein